MSNCFTISPDHSSPWARQLVTYTSPFIFRTHLFLEETNFTRPQRFPNATSVNWIAEPQGTASISALSRCRGVQKHYSCHKEPRPQVNDSNILQNSEMQSQIRWRKGRLALSSFVKSPISFDDALSSRWQNNNENKKNKQTNKQRTYNKVYGKNNRKQPLCRYYNNDSSVIDLSWILRNESK